MGAMKWGTVFLALLGVTLAAVIREDPVAVDPDTYMVGAGIADCTGPPAQINMMGYASITQNAAGLHLRQFARAFVISDNTTRVAIVSVDAGMISQLLKIEVVNRLQALYGGVYTNQNVLVSGTHTHSTPGGFFQYTIFDVTSEGFVNETFQALVEGVVTSIQRADANLQAAHIFYAEDELLNVSANRSPASYLQNPEEERSKYEYNTDKTMHLLKMVDLEGNPIGSLNWFAVHCTSMNNTNLLVSSDNKGYAALLLEQEFNPNGTRVGKGSFVAAFANANEGDSSPNTVGARCIDTGLPCDFVTSTCNGKNELCIAFGPGEDMMESTKIIGTRQYEKALELFNSASEPVHGSVQFASQNVDMTSYQVNFDNGSSVNTCIPAVGFAFAAGTTDGPGIADFHQATTVGDEDVLWYVARDLLQAPADEDVTCHAPKPILLATGRMENPVPWHPTIVQTQILRVGNIVILGMPGEFTTMSGRRIRDAVNETLFENADWAADDTHVVIQGLSNIYTHYIATFEEYQLQRYEGASTIYGPHSQLAYAQQYQKLALSIATSEALPDDLTPPDYFDDQFSFIRDNSLDLTPANYDMGDPIEDAADSYVQGDEVTVEFVCGNPRNNLMTGDTYLTVERLDEDSGSWVVVANDADWETRMQWEQSNSLLSQSVCTIIWDIPSDAQTGTYRIQHFGYAYGILSTTPYSYTGTSREFTVTAV